MGDFESFQGFDQGSESMDPAAFERFKERMAAASAQLKAIQAGEQKQKKKEDELVKILLKFIQSGQKRDLVLLVSRLLEQNVPAIFILAVLLINNDHLQQELGLKLLQPAAQEHVHVRETLPDRYLPNQALPLQMKIAIDAWIQEIGRAAAERPDRLVETTLENDGKIKRPLIQLASLCLEEFLQLNGMMTNYGSLKDFMSFILEGIIKKTNEDYKNRKKLK